MRDRSLSPQRALQALLEPLLPLLAERREPVPPAPRHILHIRIPLIRIIPHLPALQRGADLLVHEGREPGMSGNTLAAAEQPGRTNPARVFPDIPGYHTSPEDAARLAQRAGVKMLVFTHIVPALPMKPLEKAFLGKAPSLYKGRLAVGHDGDFVSLPAGGEQITLTNRSAMSR